MRMLHGLLAIAVATSPSIGTAAPSCAPTSFSLKGSTLDVGKYQLQLGEPDDEGAPQTWLGPVQVTGPGLDQACSIVVDQIGIINRPLVAFNGDHVVLNTYSGSEVTMITLDLPRCAISAKSEVLSGEVAAHGLHVLVAGKPVKGLTCADG